MMTTSDGERTRRTAEAVGESATLHIPTTDTQSPAATGSSQRTQYEVVAIEPIWLQPTHWAHHI